VANSKAAEVSALGYNASDGKLVDFRERRSTASLEENSPVCQAMADQQVS
jgi:hypothetical protein